MADIDTLRPEVREAVHAIDHGNGVFVDSDDSIGAEKWRIVLTELLRLAGDLNAARLSSETFEAKYQCMHEVDLLKAKLDIAHGVISELIANGSVRQEAVDQAAEKVRHTASIREDWPGREFFDKFYAPLTANTRNQRPA